MHGCQTLMQSCFKVFADKKLSIVNSLPNNKILGWSKLKTFADDKLKVAKIMNFVFDSVENIVVTSIFSFSQKVFKRLLSKGCYKSGLCGKG